MLPKNSFIYIGILIAFGLLFPLIVAIVWVIKKKDSRVSFFIPIIIALVISCALKTMVIGTCKVPSGSMNNNTIMEGDRLLFPKGRKAVINY